MGRSRRLPVVAETRHVITVGVGRARQIPRPGTLTRLSSLEQTAPVESEPPPMQARQRVLRPEGGEQLVAADPRRRLGLGRTLSQTGRLLRRPRVLVHCGQEVALTIHQLAEPITLAWSSTDQPWRSSHRGNQ